MRKYGSEAVFPQETGNSVALNGKILGPGQITGGLTKREHFAALALQGICGNGEAYRGTTMSSGVKTMPSDYASLSVLFADALIAELAKGEV